MTLQSWTRIEPVSRDETLAEGLQARIADPLWLLARQARFGEFHGEDAATPVTVRVRATTSRLTNWRPRDGAAQDILDAALEPLAEATNATPSEIGRLASAQAGQHYLRLLARSPNVGDSSSYRAALAKTLPIGDAVTDALRPYTGRVPDGTALYDAFRRAGLPGGGTLPDAPPLGSADREAVAAVARDWTAWYEATQLAGAGPPPTWNPARLEHEFEVSAPTPHATTTLIAREHASGSLDWHHFDLVDSTPETVPADSTAIGQLVFTALPAPVRYPGMPSPRFWEFEDARVDFGAITAPEEALATSLVVEFALTYGNDHHIIPLPLDIGATCRIDSLVVIDGFGHTTLIRPVAEIDGPDGAFRMFEHTAPDGRDPLFVLWPTIDDAIAGAAIEDVHYLRDEGADLVWAVERLAPGPDGRTVDRTSPAAEPQLSVDEDSTPSADDRLVYRWRTGIPGNWFPFLADPRSSIGRIVPGVVEQLDQGSPPTPHGEILSEQAQGGIAPEEITRSGLIVMRGWRMARWIDGRRLSWVSRTVASGRGPGASGLRFDLALPAGATPAVSPTTGPAPRPTVTRDTPVVQPRSATTMPANDQPDTQGTQIAGLSVLKGAILYAAILTFIALYTYFMIKIGQAKAKEKPPFNATLVSAAALLAGVLGSAFALEIGVPTAESGTNQGLGQAVAGPSDDAGTTSPGSGSRPNSVWTFLWRVFSLEPATTHSASWPKTFGIWAYAVVASAVAVVYICNQNETPDAIKALAIAFTGYVIALLRAAYARRG